jgi:GNAT superfamily N-acetyltransferase
MTSPLREASPLALAIAIEQNAAEFVLALGRAGGGEERDDPTIQWTIGGSPIDYHNAVVRADLPPGAVDDAIIASRERMVALRVPGTWHVGPSMRPGNLGERLAAHGFAPGTFEPGMASAIDALADPPSPRGLTIRRVRDAVGLGAWVATLAQGFGAGPHEAEWAGAMYAKIGLGDDTPWRHYVATLDGRPVAASSMFLGAGVAGIYFVFTVPAARRQGIGAAITHAPLRDARALGYHFAALGSSRIGESLYRRLGFREYCRIGIYEWQLPPA